MILSGLLTQYRNADVTSSSASRVFAGIWASGFGALQHSGRGGGLTLRLVSVLSRNMSGTIETQIDVDKVHQG